MHFNHGILISKLLIFINSKNLRTIRKLIAYENFEDYSNIIMYCRVHGKFTCHRSNNEKLQSYYDSVIRLFFFSKLFVVWSPGEGGKG